MREQPSWFQPILPQQQAHLQSRDRIPKKHLKNAENPCSALWSKEHLLIHTMEGRANRAAKAAKEYTESGSRMARLGWNWLKIATGNNKHSSFLCKGQ